MYQTLYRKYRPSNFDEIIGQDVIIKTIKNEIANNKLCHAYIFSGPRGTGKTSTAKIIAKTINCENPSNLLPCNICVNCTLYNNKQTTDIIEIDAASNNGVDEIRELRNNVNLVPTSGKYKIYIIDEVHMLSTGAFNALLKTLEEPPAHVIFILATTEIHKIPNTILSRCQKFDFNKISLEKIETKLKNISKEENIKIEDSAITEIARLSDGGMRDALSMLDQVSSYSDEIINIEMVHAVNGTISQYTLKNLIEKLNQKNYNEIFNIIDEFDNNGKSFIKLSEEIINFYRNILLLKNAKEYLKNSVSYYEIYEEFETKLTDDEIVDNIKSFNEILPEMKKTNNPRLIFEAVIIKNLNKKKQVLKEAPLKSNLDSQNKKETKKEDKKKEVPISNISSKNLKLLKELEKIRINNTLCTFNKKKMIEFKPMLEQLRVLLMNPKYSEYASLVLDGELKALGDNHLIFVYEEEKISNTFNEKILYIEEMFNETYKEKYKIISTSKSNWETVKDEFNSKKKKYDYIEEPSLSFLKQKNLIDSEFDDIIEYK